MNTTRTTSTPATASVTEDVMRASLKAHIEAVCEIQKIEANAKAAIQKIVADTEAKAKPHQETRDLHAGIVQTWCIANRPRFEKPNPRKMEVYGGHKIGLDMGQPAFTLIKPTGSTAKGKQTLEGFITACKEGLHKFAKAFIRTIEEADKDAVLRWYKEESEGSAEEKAAAAAKLAELGAKVTQTERFVIDLNLQPDAVAARA